MNDKKLLLLFKELNDWNVVKIDSTKAAQFLWDIRLEAGEVLADHTQRVQFP